MYKAIVEETKAKIFKLSKILILFFFCFLKGGILKYSLLKRVLKKPWNQRCHFRRWKRKWCTRVNERNICYTAHMVRFFRNYTMSANSQLLRWLWHYDNIWIHKLIWKFNLNIIFKNFRNRLSFKVFTPWQVMFTWGSWFV